MHANEDPESKALSPVIYELGVATYLSQQFETSLLVLKGLVAEREGSSASEVFQKTLEKKATLGQLLHVLRKRLTIPKDYDAFLKEGIDARNKVMHGFVFRNAEKFRSAAGRAELIDELREIQHIIGKRLLEANEVLEAALKAYGTSLAHFRAAAESQFETDDFNVIKRH